MSEDSSKPIPQKRKPGTFGSPLRVFLTLIVALFVGQTAALIILKLVSSQIGGQSFNTTDLQAPAFAQFAFVLLSEIIIIGLVYFFLRRRGLSIGSIGLDRKPKWSDLWYSLVGFGVFYALLIVLTVVLSALIPALDTEQAQNVGFEVLNTTGDRILAFLSLVTLAAIGEEILWRGYFFSGLRSKLKFVPTLLTTSLIFGALHLEFGSGDTLNWMAGVATLTLALILGYMRERTGSLYTPMAIHAMNNAVAFVVVFL